MLNSRVGAIVECNDIDAFENAIVSSINNKVFSKLDCLEQAKKYRMDDKFREYIELYYQQVGQ